MNTSYISDIDNITIKELERYLRYIGWTLDKQFPNSKMLLFNKTFDDEEFSLFIPSSEKFRDYKARLKDAITLIEDLEDKSFNEVIKEIYTVNVKRIDKNLVNSNKVVTNQQIGIKDGVRNNRDKISFRFISDISEQGTIPLDYGSSIIEGLKKLVLYAIYGEETPRPYFFRADRESYVSLNKYKLAQTEIGSYIFNIEIDNTDENSNQYEIDDKGHIECLTNTRKVIRRIQNGMGKIVDLKNQSNFEEFIKNGYMQGLNANMCDGILNFMHNEFEVTVESSVTWADNLPKPDNILEKVVLNNSDFSIIQRLSEKYKEVDNTNVNVIGKITRLNNQNNCKGRYVVINTKMEGKIKNIKVYLESSDYREACEAHKRENEVLVKGILSKVNKNWIIEEYEKFVVLG